VTLPVVVVLAGSLAVWANDELAPLLPGELATAASKLAIIGTQGLEAAGEVSSGSPGTSTDNSHSGATSSMMAPSAASMA
jgi:hypothetical protein